MKEKSVAAFETRERRPWARFRVRLEPYVFQVALDRRLYRMLIYFWVSVHESDEPDVPPLPALLDIGDGQPAVASTGTLTPYVGVSPMVVIGFTADVAN